MAIEKIINIRVLSGESLKQLGAIESQLKNNREELKFLNKAYDDGELTLEQYGKEVVKIKNENKQLAKEQRDLTKASESTAGSYNALSSQMNELKKAQKNLNLETQEGREQFDKYSVEIKDINNKLKKLDAKNGVYVRNVGNYKEAITDLAGGLNIMGVNVGMVSQQLTQTAGALKSVAAGTGNATKAMQVFRAALISTGIGALVVLIGSLIAYFTKTKEGSDKLSKAFAWLGGIVDGITGVFTTFGEKIVEAFENPKEAVSDLWETIKKNLINRVTAIPEFFKAQFDLVASTFSFLGGKIKQILADVPILGKSIDAEAATKQVDEALIGIKENAVKAGKALVQMGTGLDEQQQKDLAESLVKFGQQLKASADAAQRIAKMEIRLKSLNREVQLSLSILQTESELLTAIADDTTKSFKEREEAAEAARLKLEEVAAEELKIARARLAIVNEKIAQAKQNNQVTDELLDAQVAAITEVRNAENKLLLQQRENDKQRDELMQDRLERDLDILIDGFDNQKTINERIIADETKVFAQRRALLEETRRLADDSFNEQIDTIQKFTDVPINANDLIATSDAKLLNEKIRALGLSEIIEGRLLEVIRERRKAVQDLNEDDQALTKEETEARKKALQEETTDRRLSYDERLAALNKLHDESLISEREYQDQLDAIRGEERDERKKALQEETTDKRLSYDERLAALNKLHDELLISEREYQDQLAAIRGEERDERLAYYNDVANLAQSSLSTLSMLYETAENSQTAAIERRYDLELQRAKGNKEKIKQIEQRKAAELEEVNKKFAERQKRIAQTQAIIQGALAINKTIAELGGVGALTPLGVGIIAATALATGAQVALIESQGFARGGLVTGQGTGTSDSIPVRLSNGESVNTAKATSMFAPILSMLNVLGGGVAYAPAPVIPNSTITNINNQYNNDQLVSELRNVKVVLPIPTNIKETNQLNAIEANNIYVSP